MEMNMLSMEDSLGFDSDFKNKYMEMVGNFDPYMNQGEEVEEEEEEVEDEEEDVSEGFV